MVLKLSMIKYICYIIQVILVFEGIDNFRELIDLHREANVNFWLPKYFPTNIKVIVTAEK